MNWLTLLLLVAITACASFSDSPTRTPDSVEGKEPKALDYHRYYPSDFR